MHIFIPPSSMHASGQGPSAFSSGLATTTAMMARKATRRKRMVIVVSREK
jgi:hypothetical protein